MIKKYKETHKINKIILPFVCLVIISSLSPPIYAVENPSIENEQEENLEENTPVALADETWGAQTYTTSATKTISGTVLLNGTITVNSGVTLTIELASDVTTDAVIKRNFGSASEYANMFTLLSGAKLIIKGNETNQIILDGGNTFTLTSQSSNKNVTTGINYSGCAINITEAALELQYVTIQNMYSHASGSTALASAIKVNGTNEAANNIKLSNTTVKNCLNRNDDAILRLKGYVSMVDCNFINCSTDGKYGGIIKAGGGDVFCQLTMEGCTASGNYSSGWGGVILWAAAGTVTVNNTSATAFANLSNCTFTNNTAEYIGGAISSEATMSLANCTITNNTARAGGGIATFPFTLNNSTTTAGEACGLTLGEGNIISNNTATADANFIPEITKTSTNTTGTEFPAGGGGIWCLMNKEGWTCSLSIGENNTISQNTTNATGGGVFIYKKIGGDTKLLISGANISSNEAVMGGGVALHNAELEISKGTIDSNIGGYGGGVLADGGDVTMSGGSITGNKSNVGSGGGMYITSSNKDITVNITGGAIKNNVSATHGGGFCVDTEDEYFATVTLGLEACKGNNSSVHNGSCCPVIEGNEATEEGGGFCLHGDKSIVNMHCGEVQGNVAIRGAATNNVNQSSGTVNIYGGSINGGIAISSGTFNNYTQGDNANLRKVTYYSQNGTNTTSIANVTAGTTLSLVGNIFTKEGYYLIGWATNENYTNEEIMYLGSTYTVNENTNLYAVWGLEEPITSYTVYIPDALELNEKEKQGVINISASLKYFTNIASLIIKIEDKGDLTLEDSNISYTLKKDADDEEIQNGDTVAKFTNIEQSEEKLNVEVTGTPKYAGKYTDTLTFTVTYDIGSQ